MIPEIAKRGSSIKVKIKNIDKRVTRVTLMADGKKVNLKTHTLYNYAFVKVNTNYKNKNLQLKLYLKDAKGNFSMTEKLVPVK